MKNRTMRVAALLLTLTLMTSCFVGGTFAKYTTAGESMDSARVAKWGVQISSTGMMFGEHSTKTVDNAVALEYTGSVDTQGKIPGDGESKLVAPGTHGDMFKVLLSGIPEVAVRVTYVADLTLTGWKIDANEYCPIIFTVNGVTYGMYGTSATHTFGSVTVLEATVEEAIAAYSKEYPSNVELANSGVVATPAVSWEWPFSTSAENDVKDTALGNQVAAGNPATITMTVTTTVEQVD